MKTNVIIIDDFYINPDSVRSFALSQEFNVYGNYPGARTAPFLTDDVKRCIADIVRTPGGEVVDWFEHSKYTGAFQLCVKTDRTWIHSDYYNTWAGVCYLTPNAPLTAGTALYQHVSSGEYGKTTDIDHSNDGDDYSKWKMVDYIANKYNRLVLYRATLYHASNDYFGVDKETGRLFQTFFFNTQY